MSAAKLVTAMTAQYKYLARAINLRQLRNNLPSLGDGDQNTIIGFNDAFRRSFVDIAAILSDAKQLAAIDAAVDAHEEDITNPREPRQNEDGGHASLLNFTEVPQGWNRALQGQTSRRNTVSLGFRSI